MCVDPRQPVAGVAIVLASGVLGMALGLLCSAFATSEFQAVQFMPAVVMPQILLGGLFVPREQMADWLQDVSDVLPLTYVIDALGEVGRTSLLTDTLLLRNLAVVAGAAVVALVLGRVHPAPTLRGGQRPATPRPAGRCWSFRSSPSRSAASGRRSHLLDDRAYVATDDARIDGDRITIVTAPVGGTLVGWSATPGSVLHKDQAVGRIEVRDGFRRPRRSSGRPADGTVVVDSGSRGTSSPPGTRAGRRLRPGRGPGDRPGRRDGRRRGAGRAARGHQRRRLPRHHARRDRAGDQGRGRSAAVRGGGHRPCPADHPGRPGGHRDRRPRTPHARPRHERHGADPAGPVTSA